MRRQLARSRDALYEVCFVTTADRCHLLPSLLSDEQSDSLRDLYSLPTEDGELAWSSRANELRETAFRSPWLVDDAFVRRTLVDIAIVDAEVRRPFCQHDTLTSSQRHFITSLHLAPILSPSIRKFTLR